MLTEQPILITSIQCKESGGILKNRLIAFTGLFTTAGTKPLGVSNAGADSGEMIPLVAQGIALVLSSDAISVGSAVQSADDGFVEPYSSGVIVGYALDAATGADQLIRVLLN